MTYQANTTPEQSKEAREIAPLGPQVSEELSYVEEQMKGGRHEKATNKPG